jgi:TolB-like protein/Tfp pilus assembly protein PilF
MSTEIKKEIQLEIAHVLFIDIVGYSKLSINEQRTAVDQLTQIVCATEQFQKADASERLIKIATGDGMALVFYTSPEAPVRCAVELSRALKDYPQLRLRMGVHSGPVSGVIDVTGRSNLAGAGLNLAQRVMKCGDAGHILLSKHVAEDLEEYDEWRPLLHDLGTCEVKHGVPLGVVNLFSEDVGHSQLPKTFQALKKKRAHARWTLVATGLLLLAAIVAAFVLVSKKSTRSISSVPEKSIAILPFENLSEEKANAYFADGIQNEILTRLATVRDLKVISRTSTAKYQSKPDNLKTVAQELGVAAILEGAVQKAGDKLRVNVQLIDARADTHLWAKSYDRDFKDVLGVESEVSQEIAEALQANLSPSESHGLASVRTHDAEAYDLFLRGEYELHQSEIRGGVEGAALDRADAFYRQALARDPNFAEAAAELARSRLRRHWQFSPLAPAELDEVQSLIDRALALAPNLPDAHFALGIFFYYGHRQYGIALTEFNRTLELQPNNADARAYCAYVYRRRGEWERSLAYSQRAEELDPRDATIPGEIGGTYQALRQWKDSERGALRALAIDPHYALAALTLLTSRLNATGDVSSARRVLDGFPQAIESLTRGVSTDGDVVGIIGIWAYLDVIERRFTDAFQAFEKEVVNDDRAHLQLLAGRAALRVLAGQTEAAKSMGEEARPLLEARLRERPDDTLPMTWLSWVYLALGRNSDALRLARQAADSVPVEKDAMWSPIFENGLAQIEARAGAPEEAIKRLRRLLSIPAGYAVSIARLKIDPIWDPIRNRPDFQQLLSGPEQVGPNNKPTTSTQTVAERPTFASDIRPILQSSCQPCHFQGGQMYEKLPFDKPETVAKLGTKLFTRIKNEDQQRVIREFLSEQSSSADR